MLKKINRVLDPFERPFIGMLTKEDIGYKLQRHGLAGLCTFTIRTTACTSKSWFLAVPWNVSSGSTASTKPLMLLKIFTPHKGTAFREINCFL